MGLTSKGLEGDVLKIGERGNILLIFAIVLGLVFIVSFIINRNPNLKLLIAIIIFFAVWGYVRNILGTGIVSWLIGAILIFFIWRYFFLATTGLVFWVLLATGTMSALLWGTNSIVQRFTARRR